jgi:hypothetical protein
VREADVAALLVLGLLGVVQCRGDAEAPPTRSKMDLAFVLLSKPGLPSGDALAQAFGAFALEDQHLLFRPPGPGAEDALEFEVGRCGTAFVVPVSAPVPDGEADEAARFSISAIGTGWKLPPHAAQLIVTLRSPPSVSRMDALGCFTAVLGAVSEASGAVGVYWGNAGATHDPAFFISVAQEPDLVSRLMLWTGVSVSREADDRLSLLSLGMQQLELPDLLLVAPNSVDGNDALATFFDLLAYVVNRGTPIPEGDTVGRTAEERLPVRYVPSPIDASRQVWRVEMK